MKTDQLRINQLSPSAYIWYLRYLTAIDSRNIESYASFLAESCTMSMNNYPEIIGKAAIIEELSQYWKSFASLEHDLLNIYGMDSALMLEAFNHYTRHDGMQVTLRAIALTDRDKSGLVTSVRLYTDTSPLFS